MSLLRKNLLEVLRQNRDYALVKAPFVTHIDPIANIDVSLSNIAGGAGVYVRVGKGSRRCGQSNNDNSGANSYAYNANVRHEVTNLFRGRHNELLLRI